MHYDFFLNVSTFQYQLFGSESSHSEGMRLFDYSQVPTEGGLPRFTSADKKLSAPTCCRTAKDFHMILDKNAHTLWSHRGKRLRVVQFCDLGRLVCVFNGEFHKNPQNTAYSTVYKVLLRPGSKAVTAQLSLSLIKYWTRGIREKLWAEKKKKPTSNLISCVFLHL